MRTIVALLLTLLLTGCPKSAVVAAHEDLERNVATELREHFQPRWNAYVDADEDRPPLLKTSDKETLENHLKALEDSAGPAESEAAE